MPKKLLKYALNMQKNFKKYLIYFLNASSLKKKKTIFDTLAKINKFKTFVYLFFVCKFHSCRPPNILTI